MGREAFPEVKELWENLLEVRRCRKALPEVQDW